MAAGQASGVAAGTDGCENHAAGRAEPERNRDRWDPDVARVAGLFPPAPSEPVCGGVSCAACRPGAGMAWARRAEPRTHAGRWSVATEHAWPAEHRTTANPLTGEPDAGNPPGRFGGRGKVQTLISTSITGGARAVPARSSPGHARRPRSSPRLSAFPPRKLFEKSLGVAPWMTHPLWQDDRVTESERSSYAKQPDGIRNRKSARPPVPAPARSPPAPRALVVLADAGGGQHGDGLVPGPARAARAGLSAPLALTCHVA